RTLHDARPILMVKPAVRVCPVTPFSARFQVMPAQLVRAHPLKFHKEKGEVAEFIQICPDPPNLSNTPLKGSSYSMLYVVTFRLVLKRFNVMNEKYVSCVS